MNQGRFCSKNIYYFTGKGNQTKPVEKSSLAGQKAGNPGKGQIVDGLEA
jgi:hypothetical protein